MKAVRKMLQNIKKTVKSIKRFALVMTGVFLIAVLTGFATRSITHSRPATATRSDQLHAMARIVQTLAPLMNRPPKKSNADNSIDALPENLRAVAATGIIKSYPDGSWKLEKPITRGESIFYLAGFVNHISTNLRKPQIIRPGRAVFTDIPSNHWLYQSVIDLTGIGALAWLGTGDAELAADAAISTDDIAAMASAIVEYFSSDLLIVNYNGKTINVTAKGVLKELEENNWGYSFNSRDWFKLPKHQGVKPVFSDSGFARIYFKHPDFYMAGPLQLSQSHSSMGLIKLKRNFARVMDRLTLTTDLPDPATERQRLRQKLASLKKQKIRSPVPVMETGILIEEPEEAKDPEEPEQARKAPEPQRRPKAEKARTRSGRSVREIKNKSDHYSVSVSDALSGAPIADAVVIIANQEYTSDERGIVKFSARPGAILEVTAYNDGYEPLQLKHRAGYSNGPLSLSLNPASSSFSGTILCRITGKPLPGATVKIGDRGTNTDAEGHFSLKGVKPGYQQLSCYADRYLEAHEIVYIENGSSRDFKLELKPAYTASGR